jgi:hypothetical protein
VRVISLIITEEFWKGSHFIISISNAILRLHMPIVFPLSRPRAKLDRMGRALFVLWAYPRMFLLFLLFLSTDIAYILGNVHKMALSLLALHGLTEEVDHWRHVAEDSFAWLLIV